MLCYGENFHLEASLHCDLQTSIKNLSCLYQMKNIWILNTKSSTDILFYSILKLVKGIDNVLCIYSSWNVKVNSSAIS